MFHLRAPRMLTKVFKSKNLPMPVTLAPWITHVSAELDVTKASQNIRNRYFITVTKINYHFFSHFVFELKKIVKVLNLWWFWANCDIQGPSLSLRLGLGLPRRVGCAARAQWPGRSWPRLGVSDGDHDRNPAEGLQQAGKTPRGKNVIFGCSKHVDCWMTTE